MTPNELRTRITRLKARLPETTRFEHELKRRGIFDLDDQWYKTQRQHWLGWLSEYSGPGFYGRKVRTKRSAQFVYNHINCPPMVFWLAEAVGIPKAKLRRARDAALSAGTNYGRQCAAIRKAISWQSIEAQFDR